MIHGSLPGSATIEAARQFKPSKIQPPTSEARENTADFSTADTVLRWISLGFDCAVLFVSVLSLTASQRILIALGFPH